MRVFILEDDPERIKRFRQALIGHDLTVIMDVAAAKEAWEPPYNLMLLDHDLGGRTFVDSDEENTGAGFCRWLTEYYKDLGPEMIPTTLIHSYNFGGADWMHRWLVDFGVDASPFPFGASLLTSIAAFGLSQDVQASVDRIKKEREQQQLTMSDWPVYYDPDAFMD
jgi:hypothetical protein